MALVDIHFLNFRFGRMVSVDPIDAAIIEQSASVWVNVRVSPRNTIPEMAQRRLHAHQGAKYARRQTRKGNHLQRVGSAVERIATASPMGMTDHCQIDSVACAMPMGTNTMAAIREPSATVAGPCSSLRAGR
jgi:hypothetical protein